LIVLIAHAQTCPPSPIPKNKTRQTLRDLEHGRFTSRTPQTWIRRATGDHVLQRCPVASKAAKPCWRKTSFSRRTPTTLRSGTVDHEAKGFVVSGRRAMNA
jgi:hypothetical protein